MLCYFMVGYAVFEALSNEEARVFPSTIYSTLLTIEVPMSVRILQKWTFFGIYSKVSQSVLC
jgi:hypothetical protein